MASSKVSSSRDGMFEGSHSVTDHFSSQYSKYAEDMSVSEQVREAAMLFCVAEGLLEDGDLDEAMTAAEGCLEIFKIEKDTAGVHNALRLLFHVMRTQADEARNKGARSEARHCLEKAENMADEEFANFRDVGDALGQACMLLSMAEVTCAYRGSAKREDALACAEEAFEIFEESKEDKYAGLAKLGMAEIYFRKRNFHAARRHAAESVELFAKIGDQLCQATALHMAAATEARTGAVEMASRAGKKCLKLLQEVGSKRQQMSSMLSLGQIYLMKEDGRLSLSLGEAAMALLLELDDATNWEGAAVAFMAEAYVQNKQADRAVELCKTVLQPLRASNGREKEVVHIMQKLVDALSAQGDFEQATEVAEEAMALADDFGLKRLKAHVFEELSHAQLLAGQGQAALEAAEKSAKLLKELGADHDEIATRLQVVVKVQLMQGKFQEAWEQVEMAKDTAQRIEEKPLETFCLQLESRVLGLLGETQQAAKAAELAIDMLREDGDKRGECQVWESLAEIHMTAADFASGLRAVKRAELLCRDVGDSRLLAAMKHTVCRVHMAGDEQQEALNSILEAVKLARADDDARGTVQYIFCAMGIWVATLNAIDLESENKANLRLYRQGCEKALRFAREAARSAMRLEDLSAQSLGHYWVGAVQLMLGRADEAKEAAEQALELAQGKDNKEGEVHARNLFAQICLTEKDAAGAKAHLQEVQELVKEIDDPQAKEMANHLKELVMGKVSEAAVAAPTAAAADAAPVQAAAAASAPAAGQVDFVAPDHDVMKVYIIQMVKGMTGGGDEVDGDTPLMESGIDSLASVELRTQLQREFKVNLPATIMFNYPTIDGITGMLVDECTNNKITWTG